MRLSDTHSVFWPPRSVGAGICAPVLATRKAWCRSLRRLTSASPTSRCHSSRGHATCSATMLAGSAGGAQHRRARVASRLGSRVVNSRFRTNGSAAERTATDGRCATPLCFAGAASPCAIDGRARALRLSDTRAAATLDCRFRDTPRPVLAEVPSRTALPRSPRAGP
jgi:hypothetical protein